MALLKSADGFKGDTQISPNCEPVKEELAARKPGSVGRGGNRNQLEATARAGGS